MTRAAESTRSLRGEAAAKACAAQMTRGVRDEVYQARQWTVTPKLTQVAAGIGEILPPKSMMLRTRVGEASCGDLKYEMSTGMNGAPIVHSKQAGKWFTLSWKDILELADKAGIDACDKVSDTPDSAAPNRE